MPGSKRPRSEVIPEVVFLGKLVERIVSGRIRVPRFQRAFVWRQIDMHQLLESVFFGFPIGSILVWETEEHVSSAQRIGPVKVDPPPDGLVGYLLDGQQRLSTLVGTLRLREESPSIVDDVDWRVYCDLTTGEFLREPSAGPRPQHFPVRSLLNTSGFFESCRRIAHEVDDVRQAELWLNEADRLANAFRDYQLPVIRIREADLDSAVTVFARLNRKGRKMTADEMVSALTYQQDQFHLAERLGKFQTELKKRGFGTIDRVFLLRAVLAALDRDIYGKDFADIVVKDEVRAALPAAFENARSGMRGALQFLRELGVTSDRLLPYGLQFVLLGEFFRLCREPTDQVRALLSRWFWVTSFTGWFGGVNSARAKYALSEIRDLAEGTSTDFEMVDLDAPAQPFPERFDGRSARVRAFMLYLASLEPRSLRPDGGLLDSGHLLSMYGTEALGYVTSSLAERKDLVSSPANRMFVDSEEVGQAITRLSGLSANALEEILPTHGFPSAAIELVKGDDREGLIKARLNALIRGERQFMADRKVTLPSERTAATIADSEVTDEE